MERLIWIGGLAVLPVQLWLGSVVARQRRTIRALREEHR